MPTLTITNNTGAAITLHLSLGGTVTVPAGVATNLNANGQVDTIDYQGATYPLHGIWPWTGLAGAIAATHYAPNDSIYLQNNATGVTAIFPRQRAVQDDDRVSSRAPRLRTRVAGAAPDARPLYTVEFLNDTQFTGSVFMYQTEQGANVPGVCSLAWLSGRCTPHTSALFEWSTDLAVYHASTGVLRPGVVIIASQMLPCTVAQDNEATLTQTPFGLQLADQTTSPTPGVTVFVDDSVPPGVASIGVAMSGACVSAVSALPQVVVNIVSAPTYWIAFSLQEVPQGAVLSGPALTAQRLDFPPGVTSCLVSLDASSTWTVRYIS